MLKKTPLWEEHKQLGAKLGAFAGYDMPLYYDEGVMKEHEWVRTSCGIFDVSHMGQAMVVGNAARDFVETITPSSFENLALGRAKYTVLTNPEGGIIDDLIITHCMEDGYHFVLNAGCKDKDLEWIKQHLPEGLELKVFEDWALIALQGPKAEAVLKDVLGFEDIASLPYMGMMAKNDDSLFISRLGYTGEDGFEIAVPNDQACEFWQKLLAHNDCKPIGLAARDSLRLDMGYPLYGHDIDDTTSPNEADLSWVIGKNNKDFIGCERVLREREAGTERMRVGIKLTGKGVAREGSEIFNQHEKKIGVLTSGGFSPTLQEAVGMGYVESSEAELNKEIFVNVRGRNIAAKFVSMPFVEPSTKSLKKAKSQAA